MTNTKRKIKAKPFVRDLRNGMGDSELIEKYTLSASQLHKVFQKLVDAGTIDEMELFMRTSLSDSILTKVFVETQCAVQELGNLDEITAVRDLECPSEVSITEKVNTTSSIFGRILSKLADTGS